MRAISWAQAFFAFAFVLPAVATPHGNLKVPKAANSSPQETPKPLSEVELLQYELNQLREENAKLEDDKQHLLDTVRTFMESNETRLLQRQLVELAHLKTSSETRCAHERAELQAEAAQVGGQLKIETDKLNATEISARDTIQQMKDFNKQLSTKLFATQAELEETKNKAGALASDKQHVLEAMHGVLKQNDVYANEAKAKATHEQKRHRRKEAEAVAVKKLRGRVHMELHKGKNVTVDGRRLRRKPTPQEDPTLYMGDESAITDYIAAKAPMTTKAALSEDLGRWLDKGLYPGEGAGPVTSYPEAEASM